MSSPSSQAAARKRSEERLALELAAPAVPETVAKVRRSVVTLAERAGFDRSRRADVALAVTEACANVVVHAYDKATATGELVVRAEVVAERLEVVIADDGTGIAPRPDSPGLGLGLPLMASLTSLIEFREGPTGGTEILMVFEGSDATPASSFAQTG